MPKRIENAKIALLEASLENEKPEMDAKIHSKAQSRSSIPKAGRNHA